MKVKRFDRSVTVELSRHKQRFWTESVEFSRDHVAFDAPVKRILLLRSDLIALLPLLRHYAETGSPDAGPPPTH